MTYAKRLLCVSSPRLAAQALARILARTRVRDAGKLLDDLIQIKRHKNTSEYHNDNG